MASLFAGRASADAGPTVVLYTIGPGSYTFAYYGHSALCVRRSADEDGTCFDYGVPATEDASQMVWGSIRGQPVFVPVRVPESGLIELNRWQDRTIERQILPLSTEEATKLVALLEHESSARVAYAYHPYWANCTTKLRDALDAATNGRLRDGADRPAGSGTLRDLSEAGFSGRPLHLAAIALAVGPAADRLPTEWERMFLPVGLRDAVAERLGAKAEIVHQKQAPTLATSVGVGRALLVAFGLVLALVAWRGGKGSRASLAAVGVVLGAFATLVYAAAATIAYPEVSRTWTLALLWPTDFALVLLPRRFFARYLQARLATIGMVLALSIVGIVAQPLGAVAALAALPLGAAYLATLRAPHTKAAPAPQT